MPNFRQKPIDLGYTDIVAEDTDRGRFYHCPGNSYPSMTTVLGWREESWLAEWRANVGEEEANRVGGRARRIGSTMHDLFERYVKNESIDTARMMPHILHRWRMLQPILDKRVNDVGMVEAPLFSDRLRVAGRCDLIASFDDIPSIIDYKTSNRVKTHDEITSYFLQTTGYADMIEERTNGVVKIEQIVILMMVDNHGPLIFIENPYNWRDELYERIREYHEAHTHTA